MKTVKTDKNNGCPHAPVRIVPNRPVKNIFPVIIISKVEYYALFFVILFYMDFTKW